MRLSYLRIGPAPPMYGWEAAAERRLLGPDPKPRGSPSMGIVRFALRFPHTFYVVAALVLFLGVAASSMPTDIFPEINIPVVTVVWSYTGLSTPEMEQRVTTYSQYAHQLQRQRHPGTSRRRRWPASRCRRSTSSRTSISTSRSRRSSRRPTAIRALMPPGIQAAAGGAVQCLQRARAADQPEFRHAQRAAALRLRHLSDAPAAGADPRHHAADAGRRQVPPDHGRSRPAQSCSPRD